MDTIQKMEIDILCPPKRIPVIHLVQGDYCTRTIELTLLSGDDPWYLPDNAIVALRYSKADGTTGSYDSLPNGEKAYAYTGNVVTLTLAPQVLTAHGCANAQVEIVAGNAILASFTFQIMVHWDPSRPILQSKNYFNWQQWAEAQLDARLEQASASGAFTPNFTIGTVSTLAQGASATAAIRGTAQEPILDLGIPVGSDVFIDSTLTLSGYAADAQAAGDAIRQLSSDMASVRDHVVSEGTSGPWYYRKWESGRAELWGQWTAAEAVTNGGSDGQKWAILTNGNNYPFAFIGNPLLIPGIVSQESSSLVSIQSNSLYVDAGQTGPWYAVTNVQQTIKNLVWALYVTGRWQ